jgi:hypothetical protein
MDSTAEVVTLQFFQVSPDGHLRHSESAGKVGYLDPASGTEDVENCLGATSLVHLFEH